MADETAGRRPRAQSGHGRAAARPYHGLHRRSGGPIYVSAKRTQFFCDKKHGLSDCGVMGSDEKIRENNLGSFWKTNPILGGILGSIDRFAAEIRRVACRQTPLRRTRFGYGWGGNRRDACSTRRFAMSKKIWRVSPALHNMWNLGCAGSENSAHLEQLTTLPGARFLGYKAGE
jgi:hypothetical protein